MVVEADSQDGEDSKNCVLSTYAVSFRIEILTHSVHVAVLTAHAPLVGGNVSRFSFVERLTRDPSEAG